MSTKKKVATGDNPKDIESTETPSLAGAVAKKIEDAAAQTPCPNGPAEEAGHSLNEQLEAKHREAAEHYDRLLRVSAEFENYKKRSLRELEDFRKYANENLLRDLLPVVDSLQRALEVEIGSETDVGFREGIELTLREMLKVLERFAVRPIETAGKPFDPNFHQAMMQEETDQVPENTVIREFQRGYTIHDRLLRPAMVIVAKAAARDQDNTPAGDTTEAQSS